MKMLYTVSYPSIATQDAARIEDFRRAHDPQCDVVSAHFTMVFGCSAIAEEAYGAHVATVVQAARPIEFCCRYAMLGSDGRNAPRP
jgi:hypothetical protein